MKHKQDLINIKLHSVDHRPTLSLKIRRVATGAGEVTICWKKKAPMQNTNTPCIEKQVDPQDITKCVLLIEAEAEDAVRILDQLGPEKFEVEWVTRLSTGIERVSGGKVAAVVLDLTLPDSEGIETLEKVLQAAPGIPILILSKTDTEEMARQAVRRGAQDYLVKNQVDGYRLRLAVRRMLERGASRALSVENEAASVTLDSIGEAVLRTDVLGCVTYMNRIAEKMTGWNREAALGRPAGDVLRIIDAVSGVQVGDLTEIINQKNEKGRTTAGGTTWVLVRADGQQCGVETTVALTHDVDGMVTGAVATFHDVSAARSRALKMTHMAQHDALTNLPNRVLFDDRLAQAISHAERQSKQLGVMFVDLDHFKKINDSLGHELGDKLLQSVAERLVACVRRTDTVSRLGGDEFVILLSQVEHGEDADCSARKILRAMSEPHIVNDKSLDMSVSIGVSTYPADGSDANTLMNKADTAMYEAKEHGGNNYQFFQPDMQERLEERHALELGLRYALGRNEFVLHYQPKLNLETGQVTGVEALIRWPHPQLGMIYPSQFVPIAEECGLILSIGRWVLLEACKQSRAWSDLGLGVVPMAVNVSAAEFGNKDFLSGVRAVLIATGVEPANLELELTESVLMLDAESTVNTLVALKAMGVQLAIDDFGTGYSSFTYLRRFPVDVLKLHQSFVQEITENHRESPLLSAMINVGKSLKHRVVAEGIETRAQLEFLQSQGCNEGQGYFFSHPVMAEEAWKIFEANQREGVVH
jgi:diguanylate cyclase (GGDEF)-like protein/PAS domain S-box-containing protein